MVLPLILSLRFLIKEKEKEKWFHKTFKYCEAERKAMRA